ncbi:hypothetical protein NMG60_11019797 [Bertholletia excelsa]
MSHSLDDQSAASLYCPEDLADDWISDPQPSSYGVSSPPEETAIDCLIESELHHMPRPDFVRRCRDRSVDLTARQDSINWILKVHEHYRFRPVTAYLSFNYLDRILSSYSLPQGNGWPLQLLSVACLSLAAKMEEPEVPLLLDLQVFERPFFFEPKTIQRMELWVMANLNWRLRSVTPFDFLDYFVSKLGSIRSGPNFSRILSSSSDLTLSTIRIIDFLGFRPSEIAASAVLSASGESVDLLGSFWERVDKEMVGSCHQLMEEYLLDTCPSADYKDQATQQPQPQPPASPVGVLDAASCRSCDTRSEIPVSDSGAVSESASVAGSSRAEPQNKRPRSSATDVQRQRFQP